MAEIRVGVIGGGWPGRAHSKGYQDAGGFKLLACADLIPERRAQLIKEHGFTKEYAKAEELIADPQIDAVSICLPNFLHAPLAIAALRAKKHVMCEKPPAMSGAEARKMETAAKRSGKVLMFGLQQRFHPNIQAARQAIEKGYAGEVYHARSTWMRTRGIPLGTGWFTQKEKSGGGALIDIGVHMLDMAWFLMGQPKPVSVYGVAYSKFGELVPKDLKFDVDDAAFAIIRFEGNKSLELGTSWAINQPQSQNGMVLRVYGEKAAIDLFTSNGAVLYRNFDEKGNAKENPLKGPKVVLHQALMRHFRECILGKATPCAGGPEGVMLMDMLDGVYQSSESGKSVKL